MRTRPQAESGRGWRVKRAVGGGGGYPLVVYKQRYSSKIRFSFAVSLCSFNGVVHLKANNGCGECNMRL